MVATGSQLGPYRLLRRIGSGGMAEVFLAQRIGAEGFARTVAIKTILAVGAEEEGISLFLDEARVAGFLEHAAIVQTVDLGYENDTLFIVMEYVAGPALSRIIRDLKKQNRFLSPQVVAYVGARVASALDYAHRRATAPDGTPLRLVHRDISPQNIMLTRTGMVKLTDFGVARASVQTHRTRTGQVRGKAAYMAPEQVRAGQLDGRTDVFALCLVLYEALTGVRAYQRKTDIMSMRAILTDQVQPIAELNPGAPADLVQVIMKGLAKKPGDRYASAGELAEALQATYRSKSEALVEGEIVGIINELFGPEQFSSDEHGLPVEAWQPTITAQAEGAAAAPHKIPGAKLSPKIAALLQGPPDPANQVMSDIDQIAIDEGTPLSMAGMSSPGGVAASAAYAGIAQGAALRPGTQQNLGSLPGAPAHAATPTSMPPSFGTAPQPFSEPIYTPEGSLPPGYAAATPYPPGYATGAGAPYPAGITSMPSASQVAPPPRGRAIVWASVGLGVALVAAVSILLWSRDGARAPTPAPLGKNIEVRATTIDTRPTVEARDSAHAGVEPVRPSDVNGASTPDAGAPARAPIEAPVEAHAKRPKSAPDPRESEASSTPDAGHTTEPARPRDAARTTRTDSTPKPKDGADAFLARAMAAKKRADSDPELQKQLTKLLMDISVSPREPTPAELELVRRAENR